ncbi:hypothetical protein ISCU110981_12790 [Isoptericola cucumis]
MRLPRAIFVATLVLVVLGLATAFVLAGMHR